MEYTDVQGYTRSFGPVFNKTHFLKPMLKLQKDIEAITAYDDDGSVIFLNDVCNKPLAPQSNVCNIQNVWAYWQDDEAKLDESGLSNDHNDTYLDHFMQCAR